MTHRKLSLSGTWQKVLATKTERSMRRTAPSCTKLVGYGIAVALMLIAGCKDHLSGSRYASLPNGGFTACEIEFRPSHKAYLTMAGQTIAADYSVDGDRITLDTHGSPATVLTREQNGSLTGGGFLCGTLRKMQ
jgi:hypothetical protein